MNKQNIIRVTLFVSILVFNPVMADTLRIATNIQSNINTSIVENITSTLHKRGIEEKTAKKRAEELVKGDEGLFALMLDNLFYGCGDINKEEILEHFSLAALKRQDIALDSYDHLLDIYSKTTGAMPSSEMRQRLSDIAKQNRLTFS